MSVSGAEGRVIKKDADIKSVLLNQDMEFYALSLGWKATGDSVNIYDELWGRPVIEGGLLVGDYHRVGLHNYNSASEGVRNIGYVSGMGVEITPYVAFRRSLLRSRVVDLGYKFETGLGFSTRPYNKETNAENILVGGLLSAYFGMGVYAAVNVTRNLQVGADFSFRHYSNGKFYMPNKGVNTIDVGVKATYRLEPDTVRRRVYNYGIDKEFRPHLYADVSVGWAPQTLLSDWNNDYRVASKGPSDWRSSYKLHHTWLCSAALMYRYNRKYASGLGLEYTYVPFTDAIYESESQGMSNYDYELSKHVLSLSLRHEVFYKNVSFYVALGLYLHRKLGDVATVDGRAYYENLGLRWYMPQFHRRMYLGCNINACETKANCFQFHLGMRIN